MIINSKIQAFAITTTVGVMMFCYTATSAKATNVGAVTTGKTVQRAARSVAPRTHAAAKNSNVIGFWSWEVKNGNKPANLFSGALAVTAEKGEKVAGHTTFATDLKNLANSLGAFPTHAISGARNGQELNFTISSNGQRELTVQATVSADGRKLTGTLFESRMVAGKKHVEAYAWQAKRASQSNMKAFNR